MGVRSLSTTLTAAESGTPISYPGPGCTVAVTVLAPSSTESSSVFTVNAADAAPARSVTLCGGDPDNMLRLSLTATFTVSPAASVRSALTVNCTGVPSVTSLAAAAMVTTGCGSSASVTSTLADDLPAPRV